MNNYQKFYKELNSQQKLAVDAIDGPCLVLAGPGTGKTQLLSVRAASILARAKVSPENLLILTYTNSASKAMKERLAKVLGASGYEVEVDTFHSFANSVIQESAEAASYVGERILMTDVERMRVIEYILDNTDSLDDIRPFRAPYTYLKEILARISDLKKDGITPEGLESYLKNAGNSYTHMEEKYVKRLAALVKVYRRYEELKGGENKDIFDERGRYDFDDMILFAVEAFDKESALKDEYRQRYRYVMVDEFQDTNGAQLELLFRLVGDKRPNLLCVGDDDQSIYRFQGASVENFKLLTRRFPELKTIYLNDNYRSSAELIDVSRRIINLIPQEERVADKVLKSKKSWNEREIMFREFTAEEEELLYIVDKTKELKERIEKDAALSAEERSHPYNNIAVLVRKREDILKIVDAFLQAGIPYATDAKEDISGEKRVKQLLDVMELAHLDPAEHELKDLALYKVLSSDYLEIPHTDVLRFLSHVNEMRLKDGRGHTTFLTEFLRYFSSGCREIKFEKQKSMKAAADIITWLLDNAAVIPMHSLLINFIKQAGLYKYILRQYSDNKILRIRELRALGSFVNMVKTSDIAKPAIRLDDFMQEMTTRKEHGLAVQGNLVTMTQEGVRVYTAHGSKGMEFHSVIIPFCLQNKSWPVRPKADLIQLPFDLFKSKEKVRGREMIKQLMLQDETRLFYVAMTRARSSLLFTASPTEASVSSFYLTGLDIDRESPENINEEELIAKSLDSTDLEDPFIGTEEVLRDMVRNLTLNPTRLNAYITCRRRFLYNDILKLPGTKKKSLIFGNCVHKALEETYKTFQEKGRFPSFSLFRDAFNAELKFQGADKSITRDCLNKMLTLKKWFEQASKEAVMPIGLERKLLVTVGNNIIFTGKYDKVEWEDQKKGLVRVVDYKTGKPDNHLKTIDDCKDITSADCDGYLRQLVCYKLLFEKDKKELQGRKVGSGSLVFIEPVSANLGRHGYKKGDHVTKRVEISAAMVKDLEGLIEDVWGKICELRFEKLTQRDEKICRTCDFDSICWG